MITTIAITRSALDQALAASSAIGAERTVEGLNADLDATLSGMLRSAWDSIERAVKGAFTQGKDHVQGLIEASQKRIEELLQQAGARANELHAILLERMRDLMNQLLANALNLMPDTLQVGTSSLTVKSVTCTQKIHLGGKLEFNLVKLCELVSEGEFEIETEYERPALTAHRGE